MGLRDTGSQQESSPAFFLVTCRNASPVSLGILIGLFSISQYTLNPEPTVSAKVGCSGFLTFIPLQFTSGHLSRFSDFWLHKYC